MKSSKVTETDEVPNEIIRILLEDAIGFLLILEMLNLCWVTCTMPALWQIARVAASFTQKTNRPVCPQTIGQSLFSNISLFTFLIDRRLRLFEHRIWRNEKSFLRGINNDDANVLLLRLQELSFRWQDVPLYFIFLDWVKCYEKIHHCPPLHALRCFGLLQQYLDDITAIYKDLRFIVRDAWSESDLRPQAEGLRQGDPLA